MLVAAPPLAVWHREYNSFLQKNGLKGQGVPCDGGALFSGRSPSTSSYPQLEPGWDTCDVQLLGGVMRSIAPSPACPCPRRVVLATWAANCLRVMPRVSVPCGGVPQGNLLVSFPSLHSLLFPHTAQKKKGKKGKGRHGIGFI